MGTEFFFSHRLLLTDGRLNVLWLQSDDHFSHIYDKINNSNIKKKKGKKKNEKSLFSKIFEIIWILRLILTEKMKKTYDKLKKKQVKNDVSCW